MFKTFVFICNFLVDYFFGFCKKFADFFKT